MPECDDRVALLEKLVGDQLELVPFADRLLQGANRCLLPFIPPRPGNARRVVIPDEVIGPRIGRPFEITLAEALVALFRSCDSRRYCRFYRDSLRMTGVQHGQQD